ncbi:hypothetical protein TanjilG_16041 [Lupinus angustifolius]|uniref:RING-type E3 ubiquitin transferase n=1 Tax=Lupinus angustifolius TaxID=3871 RepID=A0A4P1RH79_LUPAN|nr:PREDICTED: RING-H2 finger protein ATL29-like [Lupinus angustifolius]OIW10669.1 hypothetical protein TanjilG_16041 [Lupinus angustifolius]
MFSAKPDDSESSPSSSYSSPPTIIAFALALVVVCFAGFSIVYFCRCYLLSNFNTWVFQRSTSLGGSIVNNVTSLSRGLDPLVLQTFPTFPYSTVKDLRKEKYSLECAICLLEFEDDSMLRFLTICSHVFHQECIDLWLCSNKTCPVCRKDLDSAIGEARNSHERAEDNVNVEQERRGEVSIDVKESEDHRRHSGGNNEESIPMSTSMQTHGEHMFLRSHSTGHSIVMIRGEDEGNNNDKYTLKLPEHVAVLNIVGGGRHNHSKSCTSYKDVIRPVAPCSNCGYVETVSGCSSIRANENV